jgi:hypothetical protein
MAKKTKGKAKSKTETTKVKFFGHEVLLTFLGSLIISLGAMFATINLQPLLLVWIMSTMFIWLGLLIFLYPIIKKIEDLM